MRKIISRKINQIRCQRLYGYEFPTVFISCCPKTASTWFANVLARSIPGFTYFHPESFRRPDGDGFDVTDDVLAEFRGRYCVSRSHTAASAENLARMDAAFRRYVFLVRDLRDVAVSVFHHVHERPKSSFVDTGATRTLPYRPVPPEVLQRPKEECMDAIIDIVMPGLVEFVRRWLEVNEQNDNCLILRYEDVTRNTMNVVRQTLRFFDIEPSQRRLERVLNRYHRTRMRQRRWKFRKGAIGDWRHELTPEQQDRLGRMCGDMHLDPNPHAWRNLSA
jgi:hypothetical protein